MLRIDPDIRRAETPPGALYHDPAFFRAVVERVMTRTFHVVARADEIEAPGRCVPVRLFDEPLLVARDRERALRVVSNVCTHRANLLVDAPCTLSSIRCRYHGRRFTLDGRMTHMPEFEEALDFPSARDHLPQAGVATWGPLVLASIDRTARFDARALDERLSFLPIARATFDASTSRSYAVAANWALYVDNYLEGFHIPFVHPALSQALDYGAYQTVVFDEGVLQIGVAKEGEDAFDLPEEHPDAGRRVAAWYYWLFPTTMINVYPWGLSVNVVRPLAVDRTEVLFWSFPWDPSRRARGAGSDLHRVELEDEDVVQSVQQGVRARLYSRGRYSPTREVGVHRFHRLLAAALEEG